MDWKDFKALVPGDGVVFITPAVSEMGIVLMKTAQTVTIYWFVASDDRVPRFAELALHEYSDAVYWSKKLAKCMRKL